MEWLEGYSIFSFSIGKLGWRDGEKGEFGFQDWEELTSLEFCLFVLSCGFLSSQEFSSSSAFFPILVLFFGIFPILWDLVGIFQFQLRFCCSLFPGKSEFSRLGSRCSVLLPPHPPGQISIPCVSWCDPGSWNSKSTDPSWMWSRQLHGLELLSPLKSWEFLAGQAADPAGMTEPGISHHLDLLCWIWDVLEDPRMDNPENPGAPAGPGMSPRGGVVLAKGCLEVTIPEIKRVVTCPGLSRIMGKDSQRQEKGWECLARVLTSMREHLGCCG